MLQYVFVSMSGSIYLSMINKVSIGLTVFLSVSNSKDVSSDTFNWVAGSRGEDPTMAWIPRTRKNIPSDLCESLNKITQEIDSYMEEFDRNEEQMTEMKQELESAGHEVSKRMRTVQVAGLVVGALGLLGALFTGGAGPAVAAAAAGGIVTAAAAITELLMKSVLAIMLQIKIKEFQNIVIPLGRMLAEIESICDEMEGRSGSGHREEVKELLWFVRRLKSSSAAGRRQAVKLDGFLRIILELNGKVIRSILTGDEGKQLRGLLIESAGRCETAISELRSVRGTFTQFRADIIVYELHGNHLSTVI